jgi:Family of unknown function (DUF6282)
LDGAQQGGFGRVVWFPTFDSDNHVKHFKDASEGIKVLGTDGKVLPAVRDVLKICAEQKLVVQTGHLSPTEALAVIAAGRDAGVDRLVVTHAQFEVVNMSVAQMKEAAGMGAKLELCAMGPLLGPEAHLEWMRHWRRVKVEETAATVQDIGRAKFHPRHRPRSDGQSEPGRRTTTVCPRPHESRDRQGSNHDHGTRSDRQTADGVTCLVTCALSPEHDGPKLTSSSRLAFCRSMLQQNVGASTVGASIDPTARRLRSELQVVDGISVAGVSMPPFGCS